MADPVIGALHEGTRIVGNSSRQKQADLVEREIVIAAEVGRRRLRLRRVSMREGVEDKARQGDRRQRALAAGLSVTADLERPADRGQLGSEGANMTGTARLTGLRGKRGHRPCRLVGRCQEQEGEDK